MWPVAFVGHLVACKRRGGKVSPRRTAAPSGGEPLGADCPAGVALASANPCARGVAAHRGLPVVRAHCIGLPVRRETGSVRCAHCAQTPPPQIGWRCALARAGRKPSARTRGPGPAPGTNSPQQCLRPGATPPRHRWAPQRTPSRLCNTAIGTPTARRARLGLRPRAFADKRNRPPSNVSLNSSSLNSMVQVRSKTMRRQPANIPAGPRRLGTVRSDRCRPGAAPRASRALSSVGQIHLGLESIAACTRRRHTVQRRSPHP